MRTHALTLILALASPAFPESLRHPNPAESRAGTSLWKASISALFAASAADVYSSLGRRELNPLLAGHDGRFGRKGIAIKSAITGGVIGAQWLLLRKNPASAKYAALANFGMSSVLTGAAAHNLRGRAGSPALKSQR